MKPMVDLDKELVFIGGLHRSGTSLLHRCIRGHPKVSGFSGTNAPEDEGQHLQTVYEPETRYGGPGVFGLDSDSYLDESSPLANREAARELFSEWSEHWDLDAPILVEKSPSNLVRARFLQALFPRSRFIMILRHPIAVSYATRKWDEMPLHLYRRASTAIGKTLWKLGLYGPAFRLPIWLLIRHWVVCHEKFKRDKPYIENVLVIKYEDFTDKPKSTMEEIWNFIGVETFHPKQKIKCGINQKYFDEWRELKEWPVVGSLYSRYISCKYESRMSDFGYSLDV